MVLYITIKYFLLHGPMQLIEVNYKLDPPEVSGVYFEAVIFLSSDYSDRR
jgi:hypothetical protein